LTLLAIRALLRLRLIIQTSLLGSYVTSTLETYYSNFIARFCAFICAKLPGVQDESILASGLRSVRIVIDAHSNIIRSILKELPAITISPAFMPIDRWHK